MVVSAAGLEELDLTQCDLLRAEWIRAILGSSVLKRIRSLGIPYGLGLETLASSPSLAPPPTQRMQRNKKRRRSAVGRKRCVTTC